MLIQLANGIEEIQTDKRIEQADGFKGVMTVTPGYLDVGFQGYVFRIYVRADPEIRLLRGLTKPNNEAATLLRSLTREHIISAMHHSMIHSIHTLHASASAVVRLAKRWVSGHLLSGLIPLEAIELLVTKIYSEGNSSLDVPASVSTGFLRFLQLLATHDWIR
jgi:U3 small nucleolar RNA-associated protein 22